MWSTTGGSSWGHGAASDSIEAGTFVVLTTPTFLAFLFFALEVEVSGSLFSRFSFCARPPWGPLQQKLFSDPNLLHRQKPILGYIPSLFPDEVSFIKHCLDPKWYRTVQKHQYKTISSWYSFQWKTKLGSTSVKNYDNSKWWYKPSLKCLHFKVPSYFQGVHETQVTRFVSHTLRLTKHLGSNCKQFDFNEEKEITMIFVSN